MLKTKPTIAVPTLAKCTAIMGMLPALLLAFPASVQAQACANGGGQNSVQCGTGAAATAAGTTAVGANADATDTFSTALGNNTDASGVAATAIGQGSEASQSGSTAIGRASEATGPRAIAVGNQAVAEGVSSTAIGSFSDATADQATALGASSEATGFNSVALGRNSVADQENTVSVGNGAFQRRIVQVGNGIDALDAVNLQQLTSVQDQVTANSTSLAGQAIAIGAVSDLALSNATAIEQLDFQLGQLDGSVSAGIAQAMAMGGTMIVPDSAISISLNAATYRGEQGFSGAITARVSQRVYISGAIATSTADSSPGGRVGVAFGF